MSTYQVLEITKKPTHQDPYHRIQYLHGINHDGTKWKVPVDETTIEKVKNGVWPFFVKFNNHVVKVIPANKNGRQYLKTENDGDTPDNLLSLPEHK